MENNTWTEALEEIAESIRAAFVRFWKQDIVQVGLTVGMFFALAIPLLLVILILWWIDSTGWRPAAGFYKIGQTTEYSNDQPSLHAMLSMNGRFERIPAPPPAPEVSVEA
jgi:hypothetical protein